MDEDFRLIRGGIWAVVALIVSLIGVEIGFKTVGEINANRTIEAMVQGGADPLAARCALGK